MACWTRGTRVQTEVEVKTLQVKANIVKVFLKSRGKWNIRNIYLEAALNRIQTTFPDAKDLELGPYWETDYRSRKHNYILTDWLERVELLKQVKLYKLGPHWLDYSDRNYILTDRDDLLSSVLERVELSKPDIQDIYTLLHQSNSRFSSSYDVVKKNLNFLVQNIEDFFRCNAELVCPVIEELEAVRKGLKVLGIFLRFTARRCSKLEELKDFLIHSEFLIDKLSCLLFLCCGVGNYKIIKFRLSSMLKKFMPVHEPVLREIYIKVLQASKSAYHQNSSILLLVDEFDMDFIDSLRDYVKITTEICFPSHVEKNQILSLHKDIRFLNLFFAMDMHNALLDDDDKEHNEEHYQMQIRLLERIGSMTIDIGCVIYSLHNDEVENHDGYLKLPFSDLQQIVKTTKEDARKTYQEMCLPKSLRPKFRTTTSLRGFITSLLEICHQFLNDELISECPLKDQFEMVANEIQSLNEVLIRKFAADQTSSRLDQLQSTSFNDIIYQIQHVIASFCYSRDTFWSHELGLFDAIEEIKMMKIALEHLQNKMTSEALGFQDEAGQMLYVLPAIVLVMPGIDDQLRRLETKLDLICPLRNYVQTIRLKASFLKVLLSSKGKMSTENEKLKFLLIRIQNEDEDLERLCTELIQISSERPMDMDGLVSYILERLQILEPDIQQVYNIISNYSSRFVAETSCEAIMENLNSLQGNVDDLLRCNAEFLEICPVKEEVEAVHKNLRFLRNSLGFTRKRCSNMEKLNDLLFIAVLFAENISCLLHLCCTTISGEMNDEAFMKEIKILLSSELHKFSPSESDIVREAFIKALKASKSEDGNSTLVDESDLGFLDSLGDYILELSSKDQILSLHEELQNLTIFFAMDKPLAGHSGHDEMFKSFLKRINALIIDMGCFICLLHADNDQQNGGKALELKIAISDVQEFAKIAKELTTYDTYLSKSSRPKFPRTNGQGFICFLLQNLKELLKTDQLKLSSGFVFRNPDQILIAPLNRDIEVVQKELMEIREDFSKMDTLDSQWIRFVDAAYQTEHVIDSFLSRGSSLWCHKLDLFNIVEEFRMIKVEYKASVKNKMMDGTSHLQEPSQISSVEANSTKRERLGSDEKTVKTKILIFEEEAEKMMEQLRHGSNNLHFLSIVGMPGIGKTTLAYSVLVHPSVTCHFHVHAWCSVSKPHDKRRMLLEILQEAGGESKQYNMEDTNGLEHKLYQCLKGKRYLVLMDDIWSIQAWEEVRSCFPDDENGSRIMFTSRHDNIASQAGPDRSFDHRLYPLSDDKSWELLKVKIFGDKISCPDELLSIARHEIAPNCKGLPLTIDLIAGILQVTDREEWKKVAETMKTLLFDDPQGRCQKVLQLSYSNLPDELKPCFLYFAAFPEDVDVPTKKLILMWIAEGFIKLPTDQEDDDERSLEDVAEDMLNELITRSLITVSKPRPLGGVEASRVHDLLHEFAKAKAREDSFMLNVSFPTIISSSDHDEYRLCIYPDSWMQFLQSSPSGVCVRTLISSDAQVSSDPDNSLNFKDFKLVRVLDIPQAFPKMLTLVHLRFLAIRSSERKILPEIYRFHKLETFIMDGQYRFSEDLVLDKICSMERLRHFCFVGDISLKYRTEKIFNGSILFDNLRTLYHLKMSYAEEIEKILKLFPNLVELKVLFHNPDRHLYITFPKLDFLKKLESLEVTHRNRFSKDPCKITSFPTYLKKLVLSNFHLSWTDISELGTLENLEILELQHGAFKGPIWDMVDGQFPKLKYLSLYSLDIKEWNASEDHVFCLQQLHVNFCRKLEELPSCLAELPKLQVIKLRVCSSSVEDSAQRIKEEQEEAGNDQFYVDTDAPKHV